MSHPKSILYTNEAYPSHLLCIKGLNEEVKTYETGNKYIIEFLRRQKVHLCALLRLILLLQLRDELLELPHLFFQLRQGHGAGNQLLGLKVRQGG